MCNSNQRRLEIKIMSETEAQQATKNRLLHAWESGEYSGEYLTFTSPVQFFTVFNAQRWELITQLQQLGKLSIQQLAKQLKRDLKQVEQDVAILLEQEIIEQDEQGVFVPYGEIHADFTLRVAAA